MTDFITELKLLLIATSLTTPRIIVIMSIIPVFADKSLPMMLRAWISLVLASVVVPSVAVALSGLDLGWVDYVLILLKEMFIGILIGYLTAILFWVLMSVGFFIDTQRGTMNSDLYNPAAGGSTTPLGSFLAQLGATLFFSTGAFLLFMDGVYNSYLTWPVVSYFPLFDWASVDFFLSQLDFLMYMMLLLAAPIVLRLFIAEYSMALIGRFVPQINIFILAMPIKSALAFLMLALYINFFVHYFRTELFQFSRIFTDLNEVMR